MRTPSVLVSRSIAVATASSSAGRASAEITKPGRPRFICAGVVQTSSAPAAKQAAAASGASSGTRSSRLASISDTVRAALGAAVPTIARTTFGSSAHVARPGAVAGALERQARQRAVLVGQRGDQRRAGRRRRAPPRAARRRAARPRAARASPAPAAAGARAPPRPARARRAAASRPTRSMPRLSSASATPQTSPIASTAPTSWKCTRSGSTSWMRPSACASRRNASCARARGRSGRPAASICVADRRPVAVRLAVRAAHASRAVAEMPCRTARSVCSASPSTPSPASPGAHGVRIRAGVEQRREQHVAGDAADAVEVEQPGHAPPPAARAIRAAIVPAPSPSSMFTTATPGRARAQHRQQRGHAPNAAP